jgi:hypothetical protein
MMLIHYVCKQCRDFLPVPTNGIHGGRNDSNHKDLEEEGYLISAQWKFNKERAN